MPKNTEIENTETKNTGFVKKQTLVIGIIVSLFIGFVGGTIYSSFKLTADKQVGQQSIAVPNNNPAAVPTEVPIF